MLRLVEGMTGPEIAERTGTDACVRPRQSASRHEAAAREAGTELDDGMNAIKDDLSLGRRRERLMRTSLRLERAARALPAPAGAAAVTVPRQSHRARPLLHAALHLAVAAASLLLVAAAAWFSFSVRQSGMDRAVARRRAVRRRRADRRRRRDCRSARSSRPTIAHARASTSRRSATSTSSPTAVLRLLASRAARASPRARSRRDPRAHLGAAATSSSSTRLRPRRSISGAPTRCRSTIADSAASWSRAAGSRSSTKDVSHSSRRTPCARPARAPARARRATSTRRTACVRRAYDSRFRADGRRKTGARRWTWCLSSRAGEGRLYTLAFVVAGRRAERGKVYDRLASLVPPPVGCARGIASWRLTAARSTRGGTRSVSTACRGGSIWKRKW